MYKLHVSPCNSSKDIMNLDSQNVNIKPKFDALSNGELILSL